MMVFRIILICIFFGIVFYFADRLAKWISRRNYEEKRRIYRSYMVDKLMDDADAMETFRRMSEEAENDRF